MSQAGGVAGLSAFERSLADRSTRVGRAGAAELAALQLGPDDRALLQKISGPTAISDVLARSGLPEARALQLLLSLFINGAIVILESGRAQPQQQAAPNAMYGDFVFNLRELNEDVDLDTEKKKRILFIANRLDQVSHYYILGVLPTATSGDIRNAFLERSKEFHPDAFFRRQLGSYKEHIASIFLRIKEAHDVLMNDAERRAYDATAHNFTPEEKTAVYMRQVDEQDAAKRGAFRRSKLMHAKGFAKLTMARELMNGGDIMLKEGKVREAMESYQLAIDADPRLNDARQRLIEARRMATSQRVDLAFEQAKKAASEGANDRAIGLLKNVVEAENGHQGAHSLLAEMLYQSAAEPNEIRAHARKAIELGNKSGKIRLIHGEVLLALGSKKLAKAELQAALELGEQAAKALLKKT